MAADLARQLMSNEQWERFETKDWALDGVLPDTLPTVLTMGASAYDYDLWAIGIGVRYKIDSGTE